MFYNSTTAGAGWSLGPFDEQTAKVVVGNGGDK